MGKRSIVAALVVCLLAFASAGADIGPFNPDSPPAGLNNDVTPDASAQAPPGWTQVGGAPYRSTTPILDSVTTFDDYLFAVSFFNTESGLAGGFTCTTPGGDPDTCPHVPVLYEYGAAPPLAPTWHKVALPGGDRPGYIGAIGWIAPGHAVVVGGTGTYPRREPAYDPSDPTGTLHDAAGKARVWELQDGTWTERTDLPDDMRGLTAVAFDPDQSRPAFGFAGGLAQLWRWEGHGFDEKIDSSSPTNVMLRGGEFTFRVRQLRFVPGGNRLAFAVTDGCCRERLDEDAPRLMQYTGQVGQWDADVLRPEPALGFDTIGVADPDASKVHRPNERVDLPDSFYSLTATPLNGGINAVSVVASPGGPEASNEQASIVTQPRCTGEQGSNNGAGPGGFDTEGDQAAVLARRNLSSARLLDGDGDVGNSAFGYAGIAFGLGNSTTPGSPSTLTTTGTLCGGIPSSYPGDGVPDWVVGDLRSTELTGLGARGLIVATAERPSLRPGAVDTAPDPNQVTSYQPTSTTRAQSYLASEYYLAPTYTLNAISIVGMTDTGWAVGDHGALMRRGGGEQAGGGGTDQKPPPVLPHPAGAAPPDTSAYDAFRPIVADGVPSVPSLDRQPLQTLAAPRLVPAGSPDPRPRTGTTPIEDVGQIVMSRNGAEGWAIGPNVRSIGPAGLTSVTIPGVGYGAAETVYHYTRGRWTRCDMLGISGVLPADPACAQLAGLLHFTDGFGRDQSVKLLAAARVPLERDGDPSNDGEFEVVATGTPSPLPSSGQLAPTMLLYRDGRWSLEPDAERIAIAGDVNGQPGLTQLAFDAPDDGWAGGSPLGSHGYFLFHFDGHRWSDYCASAPDCQSGGRLHFSATSAAGTAGDTPAGLVAAGSRTYLYGTRLGADGSYYPFILYHERGADAWRADAGGWDPGFGTPTGASSDIGNVYSLAVAQRADGSYEGWAFGRFGVTSVGTAGESVDRVDSAVRRLAPGDPAWQPYDDTGALHDYLVGNAVGDRSSVPGTATSRAADLSVTPAAQVQLPDGRAYAAQWATGRLFAYDPAAQRWSLVDGARPFLPGGPGNDNGGLDGPIQALAADGVDGLWVATRNLNYHGWWDTNAWSNSYFFHYTDRVHVPVFREVPNPVADPSAHLSTLAGAPDGTLWLGTTAGTVYRYDRLSGWDSRSIPGWDPGRLVTRASAVDAIAVNADGVGVAVGVGGRIADLSPAGIVLDAAAGTACSAGVQHPPCGTGQDLTAAAVAPGGSAIVAGTRRALLWRPAGGDFRAIDAPPTAPGTTFTGVSFPTPDTAYLTTDNGLLFEGGPDGAGAWHWTLKDVTAHGDLLTLNHERAQTPLRAVAVDADGRGYAVGDEGVILVRAPGDHPWKRLDTGMLDALTSVSLLAGHGSGALIGGRDGLILTAAGDSVGVAREADYFGSTSPHGSGHMFFELTGPVTGVAVAPGERAGQVEAWAAMEGRPGSGASEPDNGVDELWHYASDPSDPLLSPDDRAQPLPDTPAPRPGEVSFAAMGESQCNPAPQQTCPGMGGSTAIEEVVSQRVIAALRSQMRRPDGPRFVVFTGDAIDDASNTGSDVAEQAIGPDNADFDAPVMFRRWKDFVAARLAQAGLPLFGAIGPGDLGAATNVCPQLDAGLGQSPPGTCAGPPHERTGENLSWRQAMLSMPAPWGEGAAPGGADGLSFVAAPGQAATASNTTAPGAGPISQVSAPTGGARTHYAVDVVRDGQPEARLIVVDTSLKSLSAADPVQQPREDAGGQLAWLGRMLCVAGSASGCTRAKDEPAIVVSSAPTYSYGPGTSSGTQTDGAAFEQTVLSDHASAVVSGGLGWNGLYYALSFGVHDPCPGGAYLDQAPQPGDAPNCASATGQAPGAPDPTTALQGVTGLLSGLGAPPPPTAGTPLPFVVASSAGGRLDDNGTGTAAQGFWHGYTIVRVAADGDPAQTIVEQRPVLDWLELRGPTHRIAPGQRIALHGVGREPIGVDTGVPYDTVPIPQVVRYDQIDSPAVTHRYDLLEADPQRPWLPATDPSNDNPHHYVPLDPSIATISSQTGVVTAHRGNHGRVYAIALLSVGDMAAIDPLVFEPRRSYTPRIVRIATPAAIPPVRVLAVNPVGISLPSTPPPAAAPPPVNATLNVPAPPALPSLPGAAAPVVPPVPPAPPAPPSGQQATPLNLTVAPVGFTVPPTTGVTAQPTPPVNPSPPGGARREAKQRQAATAKSEEGNGPQSEIAENRGDQAPGPSGTGNAAFTRRDRRRPAATGFTPLTHAEAQPSAWTTGLQWGGGIGLMAAALALGFTTVRPRRRPPTIPAPAWNRRRR